MLVNTLTRFPVVWKNKNYFEQLEQKNVYQKEELALAVSQERQRLARELHDSVLQVFYGIHMIARQDVLNQSLHTASVTDPRQPTAPMAHVSLLTETGINEVRALLYELRPDLLDTEGLVAALGKRIELLRECYSLNVEAFLFGEPDLSAERKHALYCIAQEAFYNIVRHAHAHTVTVWLLQEEQAFVLIVRDDGRGFEPESSFPGHFGLQSIRERIALLNGTVSIVSAPKQGTSLYVRLPQDE